MLRVSSYCWSPASLVTSSTLRLQWLQVLSLWHGELKTVDIKTVQNQSLAMPKDWAIYSYHQYLHFVTMQMTLVKPICKMPLWASKGSSRSLTSQECSPPKKLIIWSKLRHSHNELNRTHPCRMFQRSTQILPLLTCLQPADKWI